MTSMSYEDFAEKSFAAEPVPELEFPFYREKAEKLIFTLTFGRSADSELEELAWAEAELIQFLYENGGPRGVIRESNDGYSVTYADGGDELSAARSLLRRWLGNTGLMYAGISPEDLNYGDN